MLAGSCVRNVATITEPKKTSGSNWAVMPRTRKGLASAPTIEGRCRVLIAGIMLKHFPARKSRVLWCQKSCPEVFRIVAAGDQLADARGDPGFVFLVRDPEP